MKWRRHGDLSPKGVLIRHILESFEKREHLPPRVPDRCRTHHFGRRNLEEIGHFDNLPRKYVFTEIDEQPMV